MIRILSLSKIELYALVLCIQLAVDVVAVLSVVLLVSSIKSSSC